MPFAPTALAANASARKIQLQWTQSSNPGIVTNVIYRATPPAGPFTIMACINPGTNFTDNSINRRMTYYYAVTAVNSNNQESPLSKVATARTK